MKQLRTLSVTQDDDNRRVHTRYHISWHGEVTSRDQTLSCTVLNISPGGAKLRVPRAIRRHTPVSLDLRGRGIYPGLVRWCDADLVGISFPTDHRGSNPITARHAKRARLNSRHATSCLGSISSANGTTRCHILDLSSGGARILMGEEIEHDTLLLLGVDSIGEVRGQMAWQSQKLLGITFFEKQPELVQQLVQAGSSSSVPE